MSISEPSVICINWLKVCSYHKTSLTAKQPFCIYYLISSVNTIISICHILGLYQHFWNTFWYFSLNPIALMIFPLLDVLFFFAKFLENSSEWKVRNFFLHSCFKLPLVYLFTAPHTLKICQVLLITCKHVLKTDNVLGNIARIHLPRST